MEQTSCAFNSRWSWNFTCAQPAPTSASPGRACDMKSHPHICELISRIVCRLPVTPPADDSTQVNVSASKSSSVGQTWKCLFPHKSLSCAMNSVFTCAIAAAHTLSLSLSCTLWICTAATQGAGKGSCLRQRLLRISLSKLKHERTLVDFCLRQENYNQKELAMPGTKCWWLVIRAGKSVLAVLLASENTLVTPKKLLVNIGTTFWRWPGAFLRQATGTSQSRWDYCTKN